MPGATVRPRRMPPVATAVAMERARVDLPTFGLLIRIEIELVASV